MSWTMPHRTLQIVAFLLILAATASFALGVASNMTRNGRLPGAPILSAATGAATLDAQDAVPLSDERIQGPPPPSDEDKAKAEEKKKEQEAAADDEDQAGNAVAGNAAAPPVLAAPIAGNAAAPETPPPDEPPH